MQLPKSEKGNCILKCAAALCVFHPVIPPRSLPSVASSVSPDEVLYILFRFRVQRYNNYLIYASVLQKKLQKYVVKHKKEGVSPLFFEKLNWIRLRVELRQNVSFREFTGFLQTNSDCRHPTAHILVTICANALNLLRIVFTRCFVAKLVCRDCV